MNFKKSLAVLLIGFLQAVFGLTQANAQHVYGTYSVNVKTPGTFGQVLLEAVENWSDVIILEVSGHLDASDMKYFSRLQTMVKLDLSRTDISSIGGCKGLKHLQEVVLPQSVIKIEDSAFSGCSALYSINLSRIEEIGSSAFYNCTNLAGNLEFPKLKTVGAGAFSDCSSILTIDMPVVTDIGAGAFYENAELISATIPNVKSIGLSAFECCYRLESISIPNCTYLGVSIDDDNHYDGACFRTCGSLSTVILSDNLELIPYETFSYTGLKSLKLPSKLKIIGERAFQGCSELSAIDIPEGCTWVESRAFDRCPLERISLPSTLESIGSEAFYQDRIYNTSTHEYENSYALKGVYCNAVVPIVTSAFNNDMVKGATLHVPAFSVSAYRLDDNWYKFGKIEALSGSLTDVTINNTFTIVDYSGLADNANLTLTSSSSQKIAAHVTVSGDDALSLNNYIQNQNFSSKSNGYPYCTTLVANSEIRANNITTKMQLPANRWSFVSLPYDVNVSSIAVPEGTMWVVRKYNGSNRAAMSGETWENVTSGQILNAGEGYIFHCVKEDEEDGSGYGDYIEFEFPAIDNSNKNNVFACNDLVRTVNEYPAEFSHNRGWNLIGNPYPSHFDSRFLEFSAPITVWNGSGYTAYSLTDDKYVLRPNEAFFVQCPVNSNRLGFLKAGRTHECTPVLSASYDSRSAVRTNTSRSILNFIIADDEYSDRTRLVLNEEAAYGYEIERDASKFMSNDETVPQIYIIDNGVRYAIDERPLGTGEYPLGVRIGREGDYRISLNSDVTGYDIFLTDAETGITTNLNEESYSFESAQQTSDNRFVITVVSKEGELSLDSIDGDSPAFTISGHLLYAAPGTAVSVYSVDGRPIYEGTADGAIELPSGVYLLSADNRTYKIAIK